MAPLPPRSTDPTVEAIDRAIEAAAALRGQRGYLGMSELGDECARKLWFSFRWAQNRERPAKLVKAAESGDRAEAAQANYMRMVDGITLLTVDPNTGRQFEFIDIDGHLGGHCDGLVVGLIQAPKAWHIWEHKEREEKYYKDLIKLRSENEKTALQRWHDTYYAQAQLYMHYAGLQRHYLTCSTMGCRRTIGVRTEYDATFALRLIEKARAIVHGATPPPGISSDPSFYKCKMCDFPDVCFKRRLPERNCRTCLHSSPVEEGRWHCAKHDDTIPSDAQRQHHKCHRFIPSLLPYEQTDVDGDNIIYEGFVDDGS